MLVFLLLRIYTVSKGAEIRNRYNQVPHLTQDTNGKVINLQLDTTNESQEVSPFPAGDHKTQINRRLQRHNKHKTSKFVIYSRYISLRRTWTFRCRCHYRRLKGEMWSHCITECLLKNYSIWFQDLIKQII